MMTSCTLSQNLPLCPKKQRILVNCQLLGSYELNFDVGKSNYEDIIELEAKQLK